MPFPDLNDEEVIVKVLGERSCLPGRPTNSCLQANNLYHLMQLCWRPDDRWRPCASQVATILDYLYQHPTEEACDSLEDFERQWLSVGDDYKALMVESNVYSPPLQNDGGSSKSCCIEELPIKIKSPSLQNLHGSLEDICTSPFEKIHSFPLLESKEKCWLHNDKMHDERADDDDAQFVQKISEVIRDLDDVLALEKTSSSGSGTSPDECSPKKRFLQESHDKIDENGVLDFRLDEEKDFFVDGSQSITINSTKLCNINGKKNDSSSLREEQGMNNKELVSLRSEDVVWKKEWEAGRSDEEEEDDDDWLQQVERGELSAKVKEKCRSVQDLMVLTHIEESSEGSDSESSNNKSSVQPAPYYIHSFGSVGDLRSVVLGEELRHTLERLSANNKRRDSDIPSEDYLRNSLDKCDKNGKMFEFPKKLESFFSSSQLTENVSTAVTPSNIESIADDEQPTDRSVAMLHFSAKKNECIEDADIVERKKMTCTDSNECSNPFTNEGENFRVQSSTLPEEINERFDSPSEDSFNFIASDLNTSIILGKISSLSPSNCKFSHSGGTVLEVASSEINSCGRSSNKLVEYLSDSKGAKSLHVYDSCATAINPTDCYLEKKREVPVQNFHKDLDSFSCLSSGKVESLRNLAKHCLSVSHHFQLSSDKMNCLGDCISSDFLTGKSEDSCVVVLQEEESSELLNSECLCMQESPVSEFPGEERNVGLSCGISGSQSTVECTSPLALSPSTVDCCQIYKAPVISCLTITNPSSELEKLESDSITKEMDADFIFSVDAVVKKKNSITQPDFLSNMKLDRESDTSLKSVSDQKGIVGAGMKEVDTNCEKNYGKPVDNDFERSHLLLDLVPISSNGLQEYCSEVPSLVVAPFPIPNAERGDFHVLPSETPAEKCIEKELVQSDAPNSEECDSADTEDSVFDFSPGERKSEGRVKKEEVTRGEGEEDVEGLLNLKQWTPDDERSSDSGFREKGSLSESIDDERCELEIGTEDEKEVTLDSCNYSGEKANIDENEQSHILTSDKHSLSSEISPEKGKCEEFWKWQLSSLRQAVGETASLVREASSDESGWVKGEVWDEHSNRRDSTESRGLDEASLAALRSELEEKLGASNGHFALDQEIERTNSEEQLSDEEYEERTDITIHYDAYLAQLSPILEERESVGSSELCSPAAKEVVCNSISEDSATTASVNHVTDEQAFSSCSNAKDPDAVVEEILILDTETNQSSLRAISPIDFHENDASSPEFTDSLEEDDTDKMGKEVGNLDVNSLQKHCEKDDYQPQPSNSLINNTIPFWSLQPKPLKGLPLLVPPPVSSAPMPSPEEEKASCVDRVTANPMFRDFEDIVALCQKQEEERGDVQPFWESESSDGNDSSSSGEFVWKEGERNAAIGSDSLPSGPLVYESEFAMAVIEEEDEDTDNDSLLEFVPSAWNCTAEPNWELMEGDIPAESAGEADLDSSEEANNLPTQPPFDFYKLSSEDFDFGCEGDFMVSSSSRPFELSDVGFPSLPMPGWVNEQDAPIGESVPDLLMDTMSKTKCYKEKKEESNWSSPSVSPPSSSGLGELRHTRDRLKLDLSHKLVVNEDKGEGKEEVRRREEDRGEASVLDVDKETKTAL
ncbi:hypothetical protein J437_LFUL008835 [Ladona fulva]|uniref:Uncharacterized protein n=1 Tax=Ladona fulva TaxID=123851 RepID=A0A8K0KCD5_LADFU|nr:hypothetical protein J437_LFUL008835 [Ladona fulva]